MAAELLTRPTCDSQTLMKLASGGDREAEALLCDRFASVAIEAAAPINRRDDNSDIALFALLRCIRNGTACNSPKAYIARAARNAAIDEVRYANRHPSVGDLSLSKTIDPHWNRPTEIIDAIDEAESLGFDDFDIFRLRYFDGLSFAEIADQCGESLPAIKSRFTRAVLAIRRRIAEREPHHG